MLILAAELAIDRAEVRKAFKREGVRVLVGDWTNGDPEITRFLESRGRAGVPLYLWYRPGAQRESTRFRHFDPSR